MRPDGSNPLGPVRQHQPAIAARLMSACAAMSRRRPFSGRDSGRQRSDRHRHAGPTCRRSRSRSWLPGLRESPPWQRQRPPDRQRVGPHWVRLRRASRCGRPFGHLPERARPSSVFPAGLGQRLGQDAFGVSLPARQRFDPDAVDHQAGVNPGPVVGRATGVIDQTQFPGAVDAVCTDVLIWSMVVRNSARPWPTTSRSRSVAVATAPCGNSALSSVSSVNTCC